LFALKANKRACSSTYTTAGMLDGDFILPKGLKLLQCHFLNGYFYHFVNKIGPFLGFSEL